MNFLILLPLLLSSSSFADASLSSTLESDECTMAGGVNIGWQCLHFSNEEVDINLAYEHCLTGLTNISRLARLPDPARVIAYIKNNHAETSFWAKGSDMVHEEEWIWAPHDPFINFPWTGGKPEYNEENNCLQVNSAHGDFVAENCAKEFRYICEIADYCDLAGGVNIGGQCIGISPDDAEKLKWTDAKDACEANGSILASIPDPTTTLEYIEMHIPSHHQHYILWTGGNDRAVENSFVWLNGEPFAEDFPLNLSNNMHPNPNGEDCVTLVAKRDSIHGHFNDDNCNTKHRYMCEIGLCEENCVHGICSDISTCQCDDDFKGPNCDQCVKHGFQGPDCTTCKPGFDAEKSCTECEEGFGGYDCDEIDDECIKVGGVHIGWQCLLFTNEEVVFLSAFDGCILKGGHLARIPDPARVIDYIKVKYAETSFWSSGTDMVNEGSWRWALNDPLVNFPWTEGEPKFNEYINCLQVNSARGDFVAEDCEIELRYICEIADYCDLAGGVNIGGQCIGISPDDSEKLKWTDAKDACEANGSILASMLDPITTLEYIEMHIQSHHQRYELWTGGNDRAVENSFVWVNGEPFAEDFPHNPSNNMHPNPNGEDCVTLVAKRDSIHGHFNDDNCNTKHRYMCEIGNCKENCVHGICTNDLVCHCYNDFKGPNCDQCVKPGFQRPDCTACKHGFEFDGKTCDRCKQGFDATKNCTKCEEGLKGYDCDEIDCEMVGHQCLSFHKHGHLSWYEAKETCDQRNGALVSLQYNPEGVRNYVINNHGYHKWWTGGNDLDEEGNWVWVNGKSIDPSFPWGQDQPDDNHGGQNCMLIGLNTHTFENGKCDGAHRFICEYNLDNDIFDGPFEAIWNDDQCGHISTHIPSTLEECKDYCISISECTAINFSHSWGCVLRSCGLDPPRPQWHHLNFRGYAINTDKFDGPFEAIWNNNQCGHISTHIPSTLEECKDYCISIAQCTAINFSQQLGCVLRSCGLPAPTPQWHYLDYQGYALNIDFASGRQVWRPPTPQIPF